MICTGLFLGRCIDASDAHMYWALGCHGVHWFLWSPLVHGSKWRYSFHWINDFLRYGCLWLFVFWTLSSRKDALEGQSCAILFVRDALQEDAYCRPSYYDYTRVRITQCAYGLLTDRAPLEGSARHFSHVVGRYYCNTLWILLYKDFKQLS